MLPFRQHLLTLTSPAALFLCLSWSHVFPPPLPFFVDSLSVLSYPTSLSTLFPSSVWHFPLPLTAIAPYDAPTPFLWWMLPLGNVRQLSPCPAVRFLCLLCSYILPSSRQLVIHLTSTNNVLPRCHLSPPSDDSHLSNDSQQTFPHLSDTFLSSFSNIILPQNNCHIYSFSFTNITFV